MSPLVILYLMFLSAVNAFPLGAERSYPSELSQIAWELPTYDIARKLPNPLTEIPVYWSGRVNGKSVFSMGDRCASALGAKTFGMMMCEIGGFAMPTVPVTQPDTEAGKLWDDASELFANYATGRTYVVLGENLRLNGTFFSVEFPTLKKNPNVQSIIQVNRDTCRTECYRYCPNPEDCPGLNQCAAPIMTTAEDIDFEGFIYK
ncbi:hypothetical protein BDZ94DRAFT_1308381 [Collybia nuda]|uniref:Uncharacterized protein n=1 Tax=Collybia nuda TaxID=64659 RepID=A0A9P5Y7W2_9AGAR|nr:hypothetical protein BDZ94DRAFT_1308381 [Collybia nuda]